MGTLRWVLIYIVIKKQKAAIVCSWKFGEGYSVLVRLRRSLEAVSHQV